ncbi:hypothetical protein Sjap_003013 [Stephania japonica]|uniref:Pentatricopeptide repeat-containing protein n=1 Tax=Stephania japonica TaxID=461633 RepID=A0AAP0KMY5_9MAGN
MENALSVLLRMLKKGCECDVYTYNTLIHAFHKTGNVEAVLSFYKIMAENGFSPNLITCKILNSKYYKDRKCAYKWPMENVMPSSLKNKNYLTLADKRKALLAQAGRAADRYSTMELYH